MPTQSKTAVSRGKQTKEAASLGVTRWRTGSTFMVDRASICSGMRMMPISALMLDPALAMSMMAVSTGPSSRTRDRATATPSMPSALNSTRVRCP